MITAAIFDLDGVLLDSERLWDEARERLVRSEGGRWHEGAQREMMGMSSPEWSRYLHDELGVALPPDRISDEVVDRMTELYRRGLPLIAGAREAVERVARHWPLAVASSSNRPLIDLALEVGGLDRYFSATVSSEEVARGKPAPDVYLAAALRLEVEPRACAAIEDSSNGILAARAAQMRVVAIPNAAFPPNAEAFEAADVVLTSLDELTADAIAS